MAARVSGRFAPPPPPLLDLPTAARPQVVDENGFELTEEQIAALAASAVRVQEGGQPFTSDERPPGGKAGTRAQSIVAHDVGKGKGRAEASVDGGDGEDEGEGDGDTEETDVQDDQMQVDEETQVPLLSIQER